VDTILDLLSILLAYSVYLLKGHIECHYNKTLVVKDSKIYYVVCSIEEFNNLDTMTINELHTFDSWEKNDL